MENNSTLLKANLHVAVVTQSGMSFICKDIKNGTSGKIQNREVGACYIKARLRHNCATEFHIKDVKQLLSLVDKIKEFKISARKDFLTIPSGLRTETKSLTIGDLLEYVTEENKRSREKNSQNRIKISPYSIMVKMTLQHFVPMDIKDTMKYPDRYVKNNADYSSNQQVLEIRIPLVPSLDSEEKVEEIFETFKSFLESLEPEVVLENARSTRQSLENLVGTDRYKAIVTKESDTIDVIVDNIQQNTNYDYAQTIEDNESANQDSIESDIVKSEDDDNSGSSADNTDPGEYNSVGFNS